MKSNFIIILLFSIFCLGTQAKSKGQPNIICIMTDDMAWTDVGYNGQKFYETPAIDAFSQKGMVFNCFYPGGSNCAPSRACILSGMYTHRTKIYSPNAQSKGELEYMLWNVPHRERDGDEDLIDSRENLAADVSSIAKVLNTVGYYTASRGKWHVRDDDHQGFDCWSLDGRDMSYPSKYFSDTLVADDITARALKVMEEQKDNPFFIYFNVIISKKVDNRVLEVRGDELYDLTNDEDQSEDIENTHAGLMNAHVDTFSVFLNQPATHTGQLPIPSGILE